MIRATFLFLILSLFHSSASGQSGWEWQNAQEHPGPSDKFQSRKFGKTQSEQDTLPRFHEGLRRLMAHQKAGELPGVEYGVAVATDVSRNICVTGSGHDDYLTIKYDSSGAEQWVARYDGPANGNAGDAAMGIAVDASGNVYVTGSSPGPTTSYDYATVKYNSSGTQQWVVRYNGPGNYVDQAYAIAVDASENVYVTGVSSSSGTSYDCATVKYNSSGTQQWVARYDGPPGYNDWALAIALDTSGNVHVTGLSYGSGSYSDYATVKYNGSGAEQWVARYNGPGNSYDNATGIALDASGNVYVTGISSSSGISYDYATVKYNSSGTQQWVTRYNGPANQDDVASAIALDVFGSVYVTGTSYGSGTSIDYATVKYDSSGAQQWVARYDGPSGYYDYALAIALDTSGNVHVTGESLGSDPYSDYATVKYDASGTEQWVARYNGPGNQDDAASAIALDASGKKFPPPPRFLEEICCGTTQLFPYHFHSCIHQVSHLFSTLTLISKYRFPSD